MGTVSRAALDKMLNEIDSRRARNTRATPTTNKAVVTTPVAAAPAAPTTVATPTPASGNRVVDFLVNFGTLAGAADQAEAKNTQLAANALTGNTEAAKANMQAQRTAAKTTERAAKAVITPARKAGSGIVELLASVGNIQNSADNGGLAIAETIGKATGNKALEENAKSALQYNAVAAEKGRQDVGYVGARAAAGAARGVENLINEMTALSTRAGESALREEAAYAAGMDALLGTNNAKEQTDLADKVAAAGLWTPAEFGTKYAANVESRYDVSEGIKAVGDVSETVGQMLPAVLSYYIAEGSPLFVTGLSAAGGATTEALKNGANKDAALLYGAAVGTLEAVTEKLFDGMAGVFGKSSADEWLENAVKNAVSTEAGQKAILNLANGLGEGLEEFISEVGDRVLNELSVDTDDRNFWETMDDATRSAFMGMVVSGIMQAAGSINTKDPGKAAEAVVDNVLSAWESGKSAVNTAVNTAKSTATDVGARVNELIERAKVRPAAKAPTTSNEVTPQAATANATVTGTTPLVEPSVEPVSSNKPAAVVPKTTGVEAAKSELPDTSVGAAPLGFAGDTVRGFSKNIATNMAVDENLRRESQLAPEKYFRLSNAQTRAKAEEIFNEGLDSARRTLEDALTRSEDNNEKLAPHMVPLTVLVSNELSKMGDVDAANYLVARTALQLTEAGELGQAGDIIRIAGPEGARRTMQGLFDEVNTALLVGKKGATASTKRDKVITAIIAERDAALNILKTLHDAYVAEHNNSDTDSWVKKLGNELSAAIAAKPANSSATATPIGKTMRSDLIKLADKYITRGKSAATKRTATDRLTDYFANQSEYERAWDIAWNELAKRYENNPDALAHLNELAQRRIRGEGPLSIDFANSKVTSDAILESIVELELNNKQLTVRSARDGEALTDEIFASLNAKVQAPGDNAARLRAAIRKYVFDKAQKADVGKRINLDITAALKDAGESIAEIIKKGTDSKRKTAGQIADMLITSYGVSANRAGAVSNEIVEWFNKRVADATEKRLAYLFRDRSNAQKADLKKRFTELANMGAFTHPDYSEKAFRKIFNLKDPGYVAKFTPEEIAELQNTDFDQDGAFEAFYEKVAERLGREMPATLWEQLSEIRRVAMLLNPKTYVKNAVANAPMLALRKSAERLSGAIQGALVKSGKMDAGDRTRTFTQSKASRDLAVKLYENNVDTLKGTSNKWDMNTLMRQYRKYFGNTKAGQAADAVRLFTYEMLEHGDNWFLKSAFIDSAAGYIEAQGYTDIDSIPQEVVDFAVQNALEATFKDASTLARAINLIKSKGGFAGAALDILFPFTTTPINIARRFYEYSPFGLVSSAVDAAKGDTDITTAVDNISKGLTGSAVVALGFLLRATGLITGAQDDDKDKAAWDKATGTSPYSFGGRASYDWAQPTGSLLAMGAEISDAISGNQKWHDALFNAIYSAGDAFLDMSFFKDVLDLMKGHGSPTKTLLTEIVEGGVTQMEPTVLGAFARIIDDTVRTSYTGGNLLNDVWAQGLQKMPFASKTLPASVNVKGEENKRIENDALRFLQELVNPVSVNVSEKNKVDEFLEDVYKATGNKTIFPSVAEYSVEGKNETYKLTGKQREKLQKTRGQTYYDVVELILEVADNLSREEQAQLLYMANTYAGAVARQEFLEGQGEDYNLTGVASQMAKGIAAEEDGIDLDIWFKVSEFKNDAISDEGKNGKTAQEKVIDYIDSVKASDKEKDYLYLAYYNKDSTEKNKKKALRKLPWNRD